MTEGSTCYCCLYVPTSANLQDLVGVFDSAGLKGWTFPQGSTAPEVTFKVERFLQFNRRYD
jgi:hypothetical protein